MNYKVLLPVLLLCLVAIGGILFFTGKDKQIAHAPDTASSTNQDESRATTTSENQNTDIEAAFKPTNPVSENSSGNQTASKKSTLSGDETVSEILSSFAVDASNNDAVYADDTVSINMFAQSELSDFESENYEY